jgi:hypothetical protein
MTSLLSTPTLPDLARSTLFDYEVRGRQARYRVYYQFIQHQAHLFEQNWQTTTEITETLELLAAVNPDDADPAYLEGLRYRLTDAFYAANRPAMDSICRTFRASLQE